MLQRSGLIHWSSLLLRLWATTFRISLYWPKPKICCVCSKQINTTQICRLFNSIHLYQYTSAYKNMCTTWSSNEVWVKCLVRSVCQTQGLQTWNMALRIFPLLNKTSLLPHVTTKIMWSMIFSNTMNYTYIYYILCIKYKYFINIIFKYFSMYLAIFGGKK